MSVRPKKSLGQHFLRDANIARKIVGSLEPIPGGSVLEVGPGTGVLTRLLFERFERFRALEIDREAWEYLQGEFPDRKEQILLGDFLRSDLPRTMDPPLSVIGNFPYNISSQIFFRILEMRDSVEQVVCMVQKEVGDRISAPHGSKTYGILSVLLQAWYDIELLFNVGPGVFYPPPEVRSAVIRLKRNDRVRLDCDEGLFFRVVKTAFNQRRKTLRNSLKAAFRMPEPLPGIFAKRPEQLPVADFFTLTNLLDGD